MSNVTADCKKFQLSLDAFHDGELKPSERAELESHLASCPACTERLNSIGTLVSALKKLPTQQYSQEASLKLDSLIDEQLKRPKQPLVFSPKVWAPVGIAAAIAIFAGTLQHTSKAPVTARHADKSGPIQIEPKLKDVQPIIVEKPAPVQQNRSDDQKIATKPEAVQKQPEDTGDSQLMIAASAPSSNEVAELNQGPTSFTESVGIATDEDGLYELRM